MAEKIHIPSRLKNRNKIYEVEWKKRNWGCMLTAIQYKRVCQSGHIISAETDARGSFKIWIYTGVLNGQDYGKVWGRVWDNRSDICLTRIPACPQSEEYKCETATLLLESYKDW